MARSLTSKQVQEILAEHRSLLSDRNVVSLAVRSTPTPTLVIGVISNRRLRPIGERVVAHLTDARGRPTALDLATQIIEEGEIITQAAPQQAPNAPDVQRPVRGGWPIRASPHGLGTLGVNIDYQGTYRLLSNAHVLTQHDPARIGAMIYNPPNTAPSNSLVTVTGQVPVTYYHSPDEPNFVRNVRDLAWADITPELGDPEIEVVGTPEGLRAPQPDNDTDITFYGARAGLQAVEITDFDVEYKTSGVDSAGTPIHTWWERGMRYLVFGAAPQPGDSGAALVSEYDKQVIGLHRAASSQYGYACPILP